MPPEAKKRKRKKHLCHPAGNWHADLAYSERGHIPWASASDLIATVVVKLMQDWMLNGSYNPILMFIDLRNLKCKIYLNIQESRSGKQMTVLNYFIVKCPNELMLEQNVVIILTRELQVLMLDYDL